MIDPRLVDAARVGREGVEQALAVLADALSEGGDSLGQALSLALADTALRPLGVEAVEGEDGVARDVVVFRFTRFAEQLDLAPDARDPVAEMVLLPPLGVDVDEDGGALLVGRPWSHHERLMDRECLDYGSLMLVAFVTRYGLDLATDSEVGRVRFWLAMEDPEIGTTTLVVRGLPPSAGWVRGLSWAPSASDATWMLERYERHEDARPALLELARLSDRPRRAAWARQQLAARGEDAGAPDSDAESLRRRLNVEEAPRDLPSPLVRGLQVAAPWSCCLSVLAALALAAWQWPWAALFVTMYLVLIPPGLDVMQRLGAGE